MGRRAVAQSNWLGYRRSSTCGDHCHRVAARTACHRDDDTLRVFHYRDHGAIVALVDPIWEVANTEKAAVLYIAVRLSRMLKQITLDIILAPASLGNRRCVFRTDYD